MEPAAMKTLAILGVLLPVTGCTFNTPSGSEIKIQVCLLASCGGEGSTVTPYRQTEITRSVPEPVSKPELEPEPLYSPEPTEG